VEDEVEVEVTALVLQHRPPANNLGKTWEPTHSELSALDNSDSSI